MPGPRTTAGPPPTWGERIFGAAAYLAWIVAPWFLMPLLVYRWRRNASRFVALHAVQAFLLPFALIFLNVALILAWFIAFWWTKSPALAEVLYHTTLLLTLVMSAGGVWWLMPVVPLSGRPAKLPVLARWAARIIDAPPGGRASPGPAYTAQRPEDRLLAGAAYLSLASPGLYLVGPMVVLFWKRNASRFVAFHALQALLLHAALLPAMWIVFHLGVLTLTIENLAWSPMAMFVGIAIAMALPNVVLWRGFASMLAPADALPLLGRLARWITARRGTG